MKKTNFITLGVKNHEKACKFYRALFGWKTLTNSNEHITFFDQGGWILALFPRKELAKDAKQDEKGSGFPGIALAHNVGRKGDVARFLKRAEKLGAKIAKPAQDVFWGGHSGYFKTADGHLWEVAWNPFMPHKKDGTLDLSKLQPK